MNYPTILTNLYFLLIHADGNVNEKEIILGQQMIEAEQMPKEDFLVQMALLRSRDRAKVFTESLAGLQKLTPSEKVRCIAWLCVLANGDGFMDRTEWQFIYTLYHKELRLSLDEIMKKQKELNRNYREAASLATP